MRAIYGVPVLVVLALLCLITPAMAVNQTFQAGNGNSGYQGVMVMDDQGNFAFTMVAVVNGNMATTTHTSENDGVSAGQTGTDVEGDGAFAVSGAANADGSAASTADVALGGGSIAQTGLQAPGSQGASAEDDEVGAGQSSTLVQGDSGFASSLAVEDATSCADQGDNAYSVASFEDGSVQVGHQGAGYEEGNTAGAGQSVIAVAEEADMETGATSAGGDSAFTYTSYAVPEESAAPGYAEATQHASAGNSAEAEQFSVVAVTNGGSGSAGTEAYASDDNAAGTSASFHTDIAEVQAVDQQAEASGYATASQSAQIGGTGHAEASSWASDDDGNYANTEAEVNWGGTINTDQGAAAGEIHFDPPGPIPEIGADGAAAGQLTDLFATHGGSVESTATEAGHSENSAGTEAEIHGTGNISSAQGAAAGVIWVSGEGRADGAIAAQWTDMNSTRGGEASSWAVNEDPNFATTEAGYHGTGGIEDTIQGAAAGDVKVFDEGSAEGAIAIQHTDSIWSVNAPDTVWASSFASNNGENLAGTRTYALGNGTINETTQGAIAGEGRIRDLHLEVEGAAAGQYTESIVSDVGGGAETWAKNGRENRAETEAGFHSNGEDNGAILGTLQVAGAGEVEARHLGEVEGAIAVQHTDVIDSGAELTAWASSEAHNGRENEAGTRTFALGENGLIEGTTQGAVAGEGEIYPFHLEVEGAAAGQYTDHIESDVGGGAVTWSERDPQSRRADEQSAETKAMFFGDGGYIDGTLQVAGAGAVESPFFEIEGAGAGQHTDLVNIEDGVAFTESEASTGQHREVNSAETGDKIHGDGVIDDTTQGAVAGEFDAFFVEGEGAAAGQYTDDIIVVDPDGSGSAWTRVNNGRDNRAGTEAEFDGAGLIDDTIQIGGAGEVESPFFEIEGAGAVQSTDLVTSTNGGEAESWARSRDPSSASTEAYYDGSGSIAGTIQGAGAGGIEFSRSEIEGAIAVQSTDSITSLVGGGATSSAEFRERSRRSSQTDTADSNVEFDDRGQVTGLIQGAVAGEFNVEDLFDVYGEGAVAGQHFDTLTSYGNTHSVSLIPLPTGSGFAETSASTTESGRHWSSTDSADVYAGETEFYWNKLIGTDVDYPGFVNGVTQIAGSGEINIEDPLDVKLEGAAAVQGVDEGSYVIIPTHLLTSDASYDNGADTDASIGIAAPGLGGFSYGAAGEIEDGFDIDGAIAGWLPFNPF